MLKNKSKKEWEKLKKEDFYNYAIRKFDDKIFYFDTEGKYRYTSDLEWAYENLENFTKKDMEVYGNTRNGDLFSYVYPNAIVVKAVTSRMNIGDTFESFIKQCAEYEFKEHKLPDGINRVYGRLEFLQAERDLENPKKNTFDRIRVRVSIIKIEPYKTYMETYKAYRREFDRKVLEAVKKHRSFVKYEVPVNFLKASSIQVGRDGTVEYIFELKQ